MALRPPLEALAPRDLIDLLDFGLAALGSRGALPETGL